MTLTRLFESDLLTLALLALPLLTIAAVVASTWIIGENQSGLVIKKYGAALAPGRLIALDGEAGYQARLLSPGWHFVPFRWQYRVVKVPLLVVQPGEIALVVAADGAPIPLEHMLAREVACDNFQDAEAFLRRGGERGRQLAFLTAGTYRINPALFQVINTRNADKHDMRDEDLRVAQVPTDAVGIITALDGRPIPAGDWRGRRSPSTRASSAARSSSTRVAAAACRRRCCWPGRGT